MPLVAAKCTECGAQLQIDNARDAAICKYCGMPFVTEKAIYNYNITNRITADIVNVYGSSEFKIRVGKLEEYHGESVNAVIPETVKIIAEGAFADCKGLETVSFPACLEEIQSSAFAGCEKLKDVRLPDGVITLGSYAFAGCKRLTSITIPGTVKNMGEAVFFNCTSLRELVIREGVSEISDSAFGECSELKNIVFPESLTSIGVNAFALCKKLEQIEIPETVMQISKWAFSNCHLLSEVRIPERFTSPETLLKIFIFSPYSTPIHEKVNECSKTNRCFFCGGKMNIFGDKCKSCGKPPLF